MTRSRTLFGVSLLVLVLTAAACGDDPQPTATTPAPTTPASSPSPTSTSTTPVSFDSGMASFEVSGDQDVSIEAQIDSGQYTPEDRELQLEYRGGDDGLLRMNIDLDASGTVTGAFVAIGLGGELAGDENYYYDAVRSQCEVTLDSFDGTSLSGSFTCDDLPEDSGGTIDATGTFQASAA